MIINIKLIIPLFLIFTFLCCDSEKEVNLGNGYFLLGSKANTTISKVNSTDYALYDDLILGEIVDYVFDNETILIKREISDKSKVYFQDHPLWREEELGSTQYWIIIKTNNLMKGPYDLSNYIAVRNELSISPDLKLKHEGR